MFLSSFSRGGTGSATPSRPMKNARLLRCFKKAKPSRMKKYASALVFFCALHSHIFDRPANFKFSTAYEQAFKNFPLATLPQKVQTLTYEIDTAIGLEVVF